jgi:formate hydrogenlyase subunit 6/NADH:ubiquinone oxidoreductase subunit I
MAILKFGKMIMGSLFGKPATLMYPVIPRQWRENTRGHIEIDMESCILCGICMRKCPTDAISVSRPNKNWSIQRMQCIQCGCCVEVCPKKCLLNKNEYTTPDTVKIVDCYEKPAEEPVEQKASAPNA